MPLNKETKPNPTNLERQNANLVLQILNESTIQGLFTTEK